MSTTSNHKRASYLPRNGHALRPEPRKRVVDRHDAYLYALRVAYLAHLLKPRPKRTQPAPAAAGAAGPGAAAGGPVRPKMPRTSTSSINDLMKDFTLLRESKSMRLPHGFLAELEKRLTGVMLGRERRAEYADAAVKRSCALALNAFMETGFKKRMEKDRRAEDLVLIFYSNATKALSAGRLGPDDSWKLMVDRHVALFVRLIGLVLADGDWSRDRPELVARLQTLEQKLLAHSQELYEEVKSPGGSAMVEVPVPLSYEVRDMPLVLVVVRIFGLSTTEVQLDIDRNKAQWTEQAALQDLKMYQTLLNTDSKRTLRSDDFDVEEAYEAWKKAEAPDLSQMMLAIIQANPELAKSSNAANAGAGARPGSVGTTAPGHERADSGYSSIRSVLEQSNGSAYAVDQALDMSSIQLSDKPPDGDETPFTFIPTDPRLFYRTILSFALSYDLQNNNSSATDANGSSSHLLSKESHELLSELCLRWRIPHVSRLMLFLDVCREKFLNNDLSLETLDSAFDSAKQAPAADSKKDPNNLQATFFDRSKWTLADFSLNQQILTALHEALLRDLYSVAVRCYEPKPPSVGLILGVLDAHIVTDPSFPKGDEDLGAFSEQLRQGLREKARVAYEEVVSKHLPQDQDRWEFFHIIELGKAVLGLAERIQKRYRRNPEIMGASPLTALVETMLPTFANDARDVTTRVLELAKDRGEEVPVEDGFDLYRELVEIRKVHQGALPNVEFVIPVEELLADFVWRWIKMTEQELPGWVKNAVEQDEFKVRTQHPDNIPTEEERHSVSVIDIFSSFNQTIDRIAQLNWDNDLQYAKFMTALARVIGSGIARYCDLLEARFSKEMDRLTPEQQVAASKTRQEKWMQMAKDAWNNREKVEPFQFFPESFIKLNNIEFATRHLDRLEHEVNVDACVDVIQRHAPPIAFRQRKHANYVFTIKIVEAEDLKACDINGLSDPYVVLGDEYQKRLAKTRVIHANLNPRWDEAVDITTQTPLNIVATVWDWDQLGEHDCVGRTSIKLDPSHFSDFLPREYWLDLDTQGRLLLRVSMEGERDDIQFYFGKAFRTLKRTEREMTRTITDKLSAYINHCLSRQALRRLLGKGISMATVSNFLNRNRGSAASTASQAAANAGPSELEISEALKPLFTYFDDNFAIMNQTLTHAAMLSVMTRLWKEVLVTVEGLGVPPLSDQPSAQRPLTQRELDVVFRWLDLLYDFFHAVDEETGEAAGVPADVLRSPKYFEIKTLNFFYFEPTDALVRESERMASAAAARQQANRNRLSAPANLTPGGAGAGAVGPVLGGAGGGTRRGKAKSILLSRNLGTMRRAKEEKRREAQAEPNDDTILRILRMRPEAQRYLRDRSRQKERLAAAAAAEMIVRQSLMAGGGRMAANLPRR